jgi:Na+-transporting methylmalonyl-CoA/oxaloacetate decarboxylase gamma subunit
MPSVDWGFAAYVGGVAFLTVLGVILILVIVFHFLGNFFYRMNIKSQNESGEAKKGV